MITICMAYYNRKSQLFKTLESIKQSSIINEVFLVIVDDASDPEHELFDNDFDIPHLLIKHNKEDKWWVNPGYANNIALKNIPKETTTIILQNPENYHVGDVILSAKNVKDNEYYVFACYALPATHGVELDPRVNTRIGPHLSDYEGWLCHSKYHCTEYNYLIAITPRTLEKIGLFNERFFNGVCCDDDEWVDRIRKNNIKIIHIDNPYCKHQYHYLSFLGKRSELEAINRKVLSDIRNGK